MRTSGNTAIKAILAMGIFTFLFLALVSFGLRQSLVPNVSERVTIRQKYSAFDRARAWSSLEALMQPGETAPEEHARSYIKEELARAGFRVREQRFETDSHQGVNLLARVDGDRSGALLLCAAYNTGEAGYEADAAWLLEIARALGLRRNGSALWLLWFEGNTLESSRVCLRYLQEEKQLNSVRAMLLVSKIGDVYLGIARDEGAPPWLQDLIRETAVRLGYGRHFSRVARDIPGAHSPFREAGIPALRLMDLQPGGTPLPRRETPSEMQDRLANFSAESLQAVADVFYHALPALEARLNSPGGE